MRVLSGDPYLLFPRAAVLADLQPGDPAVVGPYKLLKRLGQGGMGVVFLARSPGGRQVAVKVIRPEYANDSGFRTRPAREVGAARNVSGMFTALVVDADTQGPTPWFATAYVPGHSLAEAVETQGALPASSVLQLAAGLAEGLQAIHAVGVVHRDLKPSNVLLAADGPRVIDFGISKALESTMLTQTGMVMGSPGFLSPEQAEGFEVGPPSDVFSLGAVLTYASTGAGPFGSGPTPALMFRVVTRDPDLSAVPDTLRPVIGRCLAKDPAARPTAGELLVVLDGLGAGVGVVTPEWLPESITSTIARYVATELTPVTPPTDDARDLPRLIPAAELRAGVANLGGRDRAPVPARKRRRHRRRRPLVLLVVAAAIVVISGLAIGFGTTLGSSGRKTDLNYSTPRSGRASQSPSSQPAHGTATGSAAAFPAAVSSTAPGHAPTASSGTAQGSAPPASLPASLSMQGASA